MKEAQTTRQLELRALKTAISAITLLAIVGCAAPYIGVQYTYEVGIDVDEGYDTSAEMPSFGRARTIAFLPPHGCAFESLMGTDSESVLARNCGRTMAMIESKAKDAGWDVVSWQLFDPDGSQDTSQTAVDLIVSLNFLGTDAVDIRKDETLRGVFMKYNESRQPTYPYSVSESVAQECTDALLSTDIAESLTVFAIDAQILSGATRRVLHHYRTLQAPESSDAEISGLALYDTENFLAGCPNPPTSITAGSEPQADQPQYTSPSTGYGGVSRIERNRSTASDSDSLAVSNAKELAPRLARSSTT